MPYDQTGGGFGSVLWERMIGHTIRPNRADGFLMPYHDLIATCRESGDDIAEFVVHVDEDLTHEFSYAAEHVSHDGAISALVALDKGVQKAATRVPGNWDHVRTWISERLAEVWRMRGPCPGLGSALEALGVANGTFVAYEMQHHLKPNENPWPAKGTIADAIDVDPRTVQRSIAKMEALGYVQRIERKAKAGDNLTNQYDLRGLVKAAATFAEQKIAIREKRAAEDKSRRATPAAFALIEGGKKI